MATISNLYINLKANTSVFQKKMKKSGRTMNRFQKSANGISGSMKRMFIGITAAAGIGGLGLMLKSTMQNIDATGKLSKRIGIATEDLIGLRHAAELSGASAEGFDKSIEMFVRRLGEVKQGTGEAKEGLKAIGLKYQDLIDMNPAESFRVVADGINGLATAAERSVVAYQLFGRQGMKLLNMLEMGSEGLDKNQKMVEALNMTYSSADAKKVEDANDAVQRLRDAFGGLVKTIAVALSPTFRSLANRLTRAAVRFSKFASSVKGIIPVVAEAVIKMGKWALSLLLIQGAIKVVRGFIMGLVTAYKALAIAKAMVLAMGGPASIAILVGGLAAGALAVANMSAMIDDVVDKATKTNKMAEAMASKGGGTVAKTWTMSEAMARKVDYPTLDAMAAGNKQVAASAVDATTKTNDLLDALQKEVWRVNMSDKARRRYAIHETTNNKAHMERADRLLGLLEHAKAIADLDAINVELQFQLDTFGLSDIEKKLYPLEQIAQGMAAGEAGAFMKRTTKTGDLFTKLSEKGAALELETAAKSLTESFKTPIEKVKELTALYDKMLEAGEITEEVWGKAIASAGEQYLSGKTAKTAKGGPPNFGQFKELDIANTSIAGLAAGSVDPTLTKMDTQLEETKKQTTVLNKIANKEVIA